ncbi:putative short transient receptor potential channel 2-like protein isoform X3 [Strigops habroptila]|uniref:putative short transient receptor potential channel 2-like protein isoform X3 n=1 Tax=Strigops habroptila TaxID=2489341 RepID=UPI0011CFA57C|nr:putative short transient receptor potential channel 2-like protein isoform X3 [Strigops habroptila]
MAHGPLAGPALQDYVSRHAPRRSAGTGRGGNRDRGRDRDQEQEEDRDRDQERGRDRLRKEGGSVPAPGGPGWLRLKSALWCPSPHSRRAPGWGLGCATTSVPSQQDPKFPAENLLRADAPRPWLGCPQDRSRQLRVELQLERAIPIGYVDVGNCGCAFLQLEVGRSSWPRDRPYLPLVPSVALMTPAEARLEQNRCGVRMFKEADFPAPALGQRWDRLRLTLSQPFSRHSQFGLSFIRVRTPLDPPRPPQRPVGASCPEAAVMGSSATARAPGSAPEGAHPSSLRSEPMDSPWSSSPALSRSLFPAPCSSRREEEEEEELRLKRRLSQLEPSCLSRPARMLLSAARSRALRSRTSPRGDPALLEGGPGGAAAPGSAEGVPTRAPRDSRRGAPSRSLPGPPRAGARPRARRQRVGHSRTGGSKGGSGHRETGVCPICSACFSLELLPTHASGCGEDADGARPSSTVTGAPWVSCPICDLPFSAQEVQLHASTCGEPAGTWGSPASPSSPSPTGL